MDIKEIKQKAIDAHRKCCPYKISTTAYYKKNISVGNDIYCKPTERCRNQCHYMQQFLADIEGYGQ